MKKIRIGNDIRVSWGITTNGQQDSLEGKVLQVQMVVYNRVIDIDDFTVKGNVISFTFLGADQKLCGTYTLVCRDTTNNNLNTIDKTDAFELVPHSSDEGGSNNDNVALEVVTLSTDRDSSTIGKAATIRVGSVMTLPAGSQAYVRNSGTVNNAILDFGIPSGGDGEAGVDGNVLVAEPSSVTFNVDEKGNIDSSQDKTVKIKAYKGGEEIDGVKIWGLNMVNFKKMPQISGSELVVSGADLESVTTTDLDGNTVSVPVTQAQLDVACTIAGSSVRYMVSIRVYVNTHTFYTSLIANQREFKQSFTELNNELNDQGTKLEKYYSEWQQTARSLSYTITKNKQDTDGSISEITNRFEITASSLSSTIESNKTELDGTIETLRNQFEQTTDGISATVEKNKQDVDGTISDIQSKLEQTAESVSSTVETTKTNADNIEKLKSEFTQTAAGITSTVESNKKDTDGKIESLSSQVKQTADSISAVNNRFNPDGSLANTSGLMTTADKAELASREYVDGKVVSEAVINVLIENGVSKATIQSNQINVSGHTMKFEGDELQIDTDNFKLDKNGNVKMVGEIKANSIRLKISPSDNILGGALLLGGGNRTLPPLDVGECVNLKLVAPCITRTSPEATLKPGNSTVMLWNSANSTELPKSEAIGLGYGVFDLVGYNSDGTTYWVV